MSGAPESRKHPRLKIKWPVQVKTTKGSMDAVTLNISPDGAFISCPKPFRLNTVFDMLINAPDNKLKVRAEVVWSNRWGPDDEISPRGMGVRFLTISREHRKIIAQISLEHLKSAKVEPKALETLQTIIIEADEIKSE
jgi:hypothetical protein